MEVRAASQEDVATYADLGRAAQAWLRSRGLAQYVPAAHDEYAAAIAGRVASGTLHAVRDGGTAVGFFSLDPAASPWWPADGVPALYLAGMVVSHSARGRGVGGFIIRWCVSEASSLGCRFVRLDCHADNPWLCGYYESHGFALCGRIEQHPGYDGCLYQRVVSSPARATDAEPGATDVTSSSSVRHGGPICSKRSNLTRPKDLLATPSKPALF
jgi:GNAT superfamily N-acetyltransferase